ncbi:MAG: tetratricopeptide repeat protein [Roseinatronobacter sp.]
MIWSIRDVSTRTLAAFLALAVTTGGALGPGSGQAQVTEALPFDFSGAVLTGRVAVTDDDFRRIALSYERALRSEPDQGGFRELAMQGNLLSGNFERAAELAAASYAAGELSLVASVILQADEFQRGAYDAAVAAISDGRLTGPLSDAMAIAWGRLGKGSMSDALEAFDAAMTERPELAPFALYQKALALALVGDLEGAAAALADSEDGLSRLPRRGVLAHIAILSQLGQFEAALDLAEESFGNTPDDDVAQIIRDLEAGVAVPFTTVTAARDGMAETYFLLSAAVIGDRNEWLPLIYGRLALALRPDHADAILLTGQLLERADQFELADELYATMPATHPQYLAAQLGRANAQFQSGAREEAVDSLIALSAARPDSVLAHSALGDMLRREERFAEAVEAYARAIDLIGTLEERHWVLLYTKAIAMERMGNFDDAEPFFRRVLEFVPDEPQVLNYLGYSLIEARRNLDEALEMIERAVEGAPDSGHITDSLGWALYRLGRYEEAVPVMERAVELLPRDPVINDHLGDVYYAVGRKREAEFQWRRALSFGPAPDLDMDKIRRKLEIGKTATLAEREASEGAVSE